MRVALLLVAAIVVVGTGAVTASAGSLPDSPLYQVKVVREWIESRLALDAEAQVDVRARHMEERGREMERAVQAGKSQLVAQAVARRLEAAAKRAVDQALELRARGNPRPTLRALIVIRQAQRRLDRLATQASPAVRPSIQELRDFLHTQELRLLDGQPPRWRGF